MVDIASKAMTPRWARARATVHVNPVTLGRITKGTVPKGDVLAVARVAGIQAAKETSRLLPLCHPLPLEAVEIEFRTLRRPSRIEITALTRTTWKTGVEMEALSAVTAAGLTIYDMCKSLERGIRISRVELLEKQGGRSGTWKRTAG